MLKNEEYETEVLSYLKDIRMILNIGLHSFMKTRINEILNTEKKRKAYQASDGKTSRQVIQVSGLSKGTIIKLWRIWNSQGLGNLIKVKGGNRFVRSFSLNDFQISIQNKKK